MLQSQGKTLVNAQGQPVTGVSQNPVRIAASPASTQRLGATRLLTAGTGGLKPVVVVQGLQGLQGKLNPALVQQAVRQATNQPPSTVSSSPGKPTLIQVPGVASGSTITLQPGQLITSQQLQMLQQTGPRGKIATSVPTLAHSYQGSSVILVSWRVNVHTWNLPPHLSMKYCRFFFTYFVMVALSGNWCFPQNTLTANRAY